MQSNLLTLRHAQIHILCKNIEGKKERAILYPVTGRVEKQCVQPLENKQVESCGREDGDARRFI